MVLNLIKKFRLRFWQQWLLHAFIVVAVFLLFDTLTYLNRVNKEGYYIFYADGSPLTTWKRFLMHIADVHFALLVITCTFFIETYYHFIFKRRGIRMIIAGIVGSGVAAVLVLACSTYIMFGRSIRMEDGIQVFSLLAAYTFLYALSREFFRKRIAAAEQRYQQSQAELNALKAQLNPHFFFNTLNNIYGTALHEEAPKTAESIEQLSGLMRYVMRGTQQNFISVSEEMNFLEEYLHLQRIRLPERENIQIKTHLYYDNEPAQIAPLLLIPFIENAFKYGISVDHACSVNISLVIEKRQLDLLVENRILPVRVLEKGEGTGIQNTQKRLELLYPDRHQLAITEAEELYSVKLFINLK